MRCRVLELPDEAILLIVKQVDRHEDLPALRRTCRKFKDISDQHTYRNIMITLKEDPTVNESDKYRLYHTPRGINDIRHLTFLNQARIPHGFFYSNTICRQHSYRIGRWRNLEKAADELNEIFSHSAFLVGNEWYPEFEIPANSLVSFRWRHAVPISIKNLQSLLLKQHHSLSMLELSMVRPPTRHQVQDLKSAIRKKDFPNLQSLIYRGLSHTEPIPLNRPEKGGRFRMIRPVFQKSHATLRELVLTQDHCISQIGKTPLINGRTFDAFLCDLDELLVDPHKPEAALESVKLNLSLLELGGFKVRSLFDRSVTPKISIQLSALRRLVLSDCDGLVKLLRDMEARKEELRLKEVGFRVTEEDFAYENFALLKDAMRDFLVSFQGLELLSILWDGRQNAITEGAFSQVMTRHSKSLRAWNICIRYDGLTSEEDASDLRFVSMSWNRDLCVRTCEPAERPDLREIALQLPLDLPLDYPTNCYGNLRLLSQFKELRTVHIRNFPHLWGHQYWRDENGRVSHIAENEAAKIAEVIALPYYRRPLELKHATDEYGLEYELDKLVEMHCAVRDKELLGGVKLESVDHIQGSRSDIMPVLEKRADIDGEFATIWRNIQDDNASPAEHVIYDEVVGKVHRALGIEAPQVKPKLRLLIVGDWRYRDQMNLSGPRHWDPRAWCAQKWDSLAHEDKMVLDFGEEDSDEDETGHLRSGESINVHGDMLYRMRVGFKREWDVSLLPIFFQIDWKIEQDEDNKYRWKAQSTPLKQTTLEGYRALGDVRLLDFAFQN